MGVKKASRKRKTNRKKTQIINHPITSMSSDHLVSDFEETGSDLVRQDGLIISSTSESSNSRKNLFALSSAFKRFKSARIDREQLFGVWDYLIITLSIVSMFAIFIQLHRELSTELTKLLQLFDWITCAFFFIDFLLRLNVAQSKKDYLRWGWIDLISSIPMLEMFRWGRVFRLIRIMRAIRGAVRGTQKMKMSDPFLSAVIIYFLCVFLGAASVLYLEAEVPESNIKNAHDAIWWAMVTVTTVGYGDFTPITTEGRLLAVLLMSSGIGLFGVFSVQCTQYLLKRWHDDEDQKIDQIQTELILVKQELTQVRTLLERVNQRFEDSPLAQSPLAQSPLAQSPSAPTNQEDVPPKE